MAVLSQWFCTPEGRALARVEWQSLADWLDGEQREVVVRVGGSWLADDLIRDLRPRCYCRLDWEAGPGSDARTALTRLPLRRESVGLLLLVHALDVSPEPERLLEEAAQVLTPEGELLVLGFNSWSLWGIRHRHDGPGPTAPPGPVGSNAWRPGWPGSTCCRPTSVALRR